MPAISVNDLVVGEGDNFVDVVVRLDVPGTLPISVKYATASGTADGSGYDFENASGTLNFAVGETSKVVRIQLAQYEGAEGMEFFRLNLSAPVNASLERASAMITVIDNDNIVDTPSVFVRDVVVDEKDGTASFVVMLGQANGQASNSTVTVDYATTPDSALSGSDFVARSGTLSFAPGESAKTVVVDLVDDSTLEGLERFGLTLSHANGAQIADGSAVAEIGPSDATPTSQPKISIEDRVVGEGDGYVDFVVQLSAPGQNPVSVNYATASGTADGSGYDFENASGTLNFAVGETSKVVRIQLAQYEGAEGMEFFRLNLSAPVNASLERASAMITVIDNDNIVDTPSVFVRDVVVDEKDGTASFVVMLGQANGQASNSTVTVDYATTPDSALSGSDFVARSGTLSFAPGESAKTVVVDLVDDSTLEGLERFGLTLSHANGAQIADGSAVAEIGPSDATPTSQPKISIEDRVVGEGDGYVDFVVQLSAPGQNPVSVNYATASGTADGSGYDFENASGTLNFAVGETSKVVRIQLAQYEGAEGMEFFRLNLSAPVNASLERASAMITVIDNDNIVDTPSVFVRDVVVDEKDGTASFVVMLGQANGQASNSTVTVDYATTPDSALSGSDFVARSGTLSFAPGESAKTVVVDLVDDSTLEGLERFGLTLSHANGAQIADGSAVAEIGPSDATPTSQPKISIEDRVVGEGDGYVDFVVQLSAPGQNPVSVNYATASGSADGSGYDFENASGTLNFAVGETSKVVRIQLAQYEGAEGMEFFRLNLSAPVNASLERASAMITVIDNDNIVDTPSVFVRDVVVDEKDGTASFVVMLGQAGTGQASNSAVTVDYVTAAGTALAGSDYVARSGTLSFAPGESVKTVVVDLIDDGLTEGLERFGLTLSNASGAQIVDGRAVAEIGASDGKGTSAPTLSAVPRQVSEGDGYVDVLVKLSAPSANVVSVNYATGSGTADGSGYDFANASGVLNFQAGETTKSVRIEVTSYQAAEPVETFKFNLSSPVNASLVTASINITIVDDDSNDGSRDNSAGRGNDVYVLNDSRDRFVEEVDGGVDTVLAGISFTLPVALENLVLTGLAALNATGNESSNVLQGNVANNRFDGLAGIDTVVFSGPSTAYAVSGSNASRTVSSATDGSDTLLSIERLQFSDTVIAYDTQAGGNTYAAFAMLNAAFNTAPSTPMLSQWTAQLDQLGNLRDLAQAMINFYAPGVPDDALVAHLWSTIVGAPINATDLRNFVGLIENGTFTQASLLEFVTTYELNTAEVVGIVGQPLTLDPAWFPLPGA
jgi:hypothetical protein